MNRMKCTPAGNCQQDRQFEVGPAGEMPTKPGPPLPGAWRLGTVRYLPYLTLSVLRTWYLPHV